MPDSGPFAATAARLRSRGWDVYVDVDLGPRRSGGDAYTEPFEHDLVAFAPDRRLVAAAHLAPVTGGRLSGAAVDWVNRHSSDAGVVHEIVNPRHRAEHKRRLAAEHLGLPVSRVFGVAVVADDVDISAVGRGQRVDVPLVACSGLEDLLDGLERAGALTSAMVQRARGKLTRLGASARDGDRALRRFLLQHGFEPTGRTLVAGTGEQVVEARRDGERFAVWITDATRSGAAGGPRRAVAALRRLLDARQPARGVPLLSGSHLALPLPVPDGDSLAHVLLRDGPLSIERAMSVGRELADYLVDLDRAGVEHQNLRPSHVFLGPPLQVTSLLHCRLDGAPGATRDLLAEHGPDRYLAPEVRALDDGRAKGLADLWGWGVVVSAAVLRTPNHDDPAADARMAGERGLPPAWCEALESTRDADPTTRRPRSAIELSTLICAS